MALACNIDAAGKAYRFRAGLVLLAVAAVVALAWAVPSASRLGGILAGALALGGAFSLFEARGSSDRPPAPAGRARAGAAPPAGAPPPPARAARWPPRTGTAGRGRRRPGHRRWPGSRPTPPAGGCRRWRCRWDPSAAGAAW